MENKLAGHKKFRIKLDDSKYILPEKRVVCKKNVVQNRKKYKVIKNHIDTYLDSFKWKPKRVCNGPFELHPKIRKNRNSKRLPKAFYNRANICLPPRTYQSSNSVEVTSTSTFAPRIASTPISLLKKPSPIQERNKNILDQDTVQKRKLYINFCDRINTSISKSLNKRFEKHDGSIKRLSINLKSIYKNAAGEENSNSDISQNSQDSDGNIPLLAHEILDEKIMENFNNHCQDFIAFTKDNSNENTFQLNNNLTTSIPMDIDDEEVVNPIKNLSIQLEEYSYSNDRPSKRTEATQTDTHCVYKPWCFKAESVNNEPSANTFSKNFDQNFSTFTKPKTTFDNYDCDLLVEKVLKELENKSKSPEQTHKFSDDATLIKYFTNETAPSKRKHEQSTTLQKFDNFHEYNTNYSEIFESDNELIDPSLSANNVHNSLINFSPITVSSCTSSIYMEKYIGFEIFD